jgi:hypothetical protein
MPTPNDWSLAAKKLRADPWPQFHAVLISLGIVDRNGSCVNTSERNEVESSFEGRILDGFVRLNVVNTEVTTIMEGSRGFRQLTSDSPKSMSAKLCSGD